MVDSEPIGLTTVDWWPLGLLSDIFNPPSGSWAV